MNGIYHLLVGFLCPIINPEQYGSFKASSPLKLLRNIKPASQSDIKTHDEQVTDPRSSAYFTHLYNRSFSFERRRKVEVGKGRKTGLARERALRYHLFDEASPFVGIHLCYRVIKYSSIKIERGSANLRSRIPF